MALPFAHPEPTDDYERNLLSHIESHGCSVTSVFDPDEVEPPFTYSIGIAKMTSAPELIIVGLKRELAHSLINNYNRRVVAGGTFVEGLAYDGFLEGFSVMFAPVAREHRREYMRSTTWLHGGGDFDALQLIWPSTSGIWPWADEASDWLRANQPLLQDGPTISPRP